jgi:hypothetical protein
MSRDDVVAVLWLWSCFIFIGCLVGLWLRGTL